MKKLALAMLVATLPWTAAHAATLALLNPDFELAKPDGRAVSWFVLQHAGQDAYDFRTDEKKPFRGKLSLRGTRTADNAYGLIQQRLPAAGLIGKTLRVSMHVRSKDVGPKGVVLFMTFDGAIGIIDQATSPPIAGTTRWRKIEFSAKVPELTQAIVIGANLQDGGSFWLDEVRVESD